ncbi:type II toxin-antitoxin system HicA family toxin [Halorussus caseinilyticus]|uniref:Type II toxin-antitoxin system HicA family toxin n=1 Tax=Halorussus caseinilyticus TaxID=3034025 RepID=A0ABD5WSN5_9EURY|nr:type II toxin-antitoxin system HicA family toxin [Halorussus sp. DT72]
MPPTDFSGRDVVKALTKNRFCVVDRTGSHVKLRYEHPTNPDDVRVVSVPMHDRVRVGTLRSIARQCGANGFEEWCRWIDRNR